MSLNRVGLLTVALTAYVAAIGLALAAAPSAAPAQGPAAAQTAPGQVPAATPPGGNQPGSFAGDQACLTCHEDQDRQIKSTIHGKPQHPRTPAASGRACETCHGPGQAHVDAGGDPALIIRIAALPAREASAICATCHNRGTHALWSGSVHDQRSLSCVTCHSVHNPRSPSAQLKAASELATCAQCHKPQVLRTQRASHMPVREGSMTCSSCHNPHGATNVRLLRAGNWINESCASCHAEKRGPFLWEHAAGRESCISCHDPHGSSNDRMLVAKLPMLCQRCHIGTRHPSTIYDDSVRTTSNRLFSRSCVNCHQNIHGSNHPSGHTFLR